MKLKYLPLVAFAALTAGSTSSHAGIFRKVFNNFRDCDWDYSNPVEKAITDYERLTTPPPKNANYPIIPFQESDFQTKPFLRGFEYVIVINSSNSVVQNEELPSQIPLFLPGPMSLGLTLPKSDSSLSAAQNFQAQFGNLAKGVFQFGTVKKAADKKTAVPSNIQGAQTIRVYRRGQLIRVARVSTGRHQFEIRGQNPKCQTRPSTSYYSITEPGYFTFQELVKSGYKSASYDDADMPNAMFYMRNRGIALHEEPYDNLIARLGVRASGGCTRLDPDTATNLFDSIYATKGSAIPVVKRNGEPVLNAAGHPLLKTQETVVYYEGTDRQRENVMPTYSALLIVQPDTVTSFFPEVEKAANFRFSRSQFSSQGPARF